MFGRATITLGIGPHSSLGYISPTGPDAPKGTKFGTAVGVAKVII